MSVFCLKLIAMSSMLVDHIAIGFVSETQFLMRNVGRFAFIIYAFLIAESYHHIRSAQSKVIYHVLKILMLAIVAEIPYDVFEYNRWNAPGTQNVLWTLLLGFCVLIASDYAHKMIDNSVVSYLICFAVSFAAAATAFKIRCEYDCSGVLLIVLFYLYLIKADSFNRLQRVLTILLIEALFSFLYVWSCAHFGSWPIIVSWGRSLKMYFWGVTGAFVVLALYNRKLGYNSKWFSWIYSIFYPLQFVLLIIARYFIRRFC